MHYPSFLTDKKARLPRLSFPKTWRLLMTGVTSIHGWPIYKRLKTLLPAEQLRAVRPPQMAQPEADNVKEMCVLDEAGFRQMAADFKPTHILHAAGVCDLDACEDRPEWAQALNQGGARQVVQLFGPSCYIMFLSTDLVFSGNHPPEGGYAEHHEPDPVSVAAATFLAAEKEIVRASRHCVVRLALPVGASLTGAKGAVDFIEGRFKRRLPMTLFHDEIRSCVTCEELTDMVLYLLAKEATGCFHVGGKQGISLHELGKAIIKKGNYPPVLLKRLSRHEEIGGPPRIGNVHLNSAKLEAWFDEVYFRRKN